MRLKVLLIICFNILLSNFLVAQESQSALGVLVQEKLTPIDLLLVNKNAKKGTPFLHEGSLYLFFKAKEDTRYVAVAFNYDSYSQKYLMYRHDRNTFFAKVTPPLGKRQVEYRYIVDGVWTSDENNPNYKENFLGDRFSFLNLSDWDTSLALVNPSYTSQGKTILYFLGEPDQKVNIAGNFNNWNPFLHRLEEEKERPGVYSVELDLPSGEIVYYFLANGKRHLDSLNPNKMQASFLRELEGEAGYNVSSFIKD